MKPITREWVKKAEGDFATAQREIRARKNPNYDASCFHSQQCVEKYLKARLQEANITFGKTHDLSTLLDLALEIEPTWDALREDLRALTVFAVGYRYPGDAADKELAREAVTRCRKVRRIIRHSLSL